MQLVHAPVFSAASRIRPRTALVASSDRSFRQRLSSILTGLRWQVTEAEGGAEVWAHAETTIPDAIIVDSWLPDLDMAELLGDLRKAYPAVDLLTTGSFPVQDSPRGPYRQELLYALRRSQETDTAAWNAAPALENPVPVLGGAPAALDPIKADNRTASPTVERFPAILVLPAVAPIPILVRRTDSQLVDRLPELIGNAPCMLEVSRRIRLVAARMTPVLIEGPTGSGKELVAEGLHRLSPRSRKPFVAINCAAIPEALLEAELFGHTRGAFTGAVHSRVCRIESADGGTLFLDEIGEMPLALQSKLLRFVECGELQRVGENDTVKVDVRIVAATHQALADQTQSGAFRSDLYYRLAVFLIRTPSLADHAEDIPVLVAHFMEKMGRQAPVKQIDASALAKLVAHSWPGNVRELEHVLERASILAGEESVLSAQDIDFGITVN